ncbi:Ig-like domain-containing protein [Flavobacterium aquiphilum]|uniref:Ig-like domain-containing protein n=1 Tax=Flavobacterium aquiphilum TaxID=3003261 RepID=UPI00247FCB4D|nr:Ig-like domain-containing protein [Flavobacterium aquiphilum]
MKKDYSLFYLHGCKKDSQQKYKRLCKLFICLLLFFATLHNARAQDIIYQDDFEGAATGWLGNFTVLDATTSVSPTHSLKYTRASTSYSLFAGPDITTGFTIGQSYNASIMVKTALTGGSATEGAKLVLVAYNGTTFISSTTTAITRSTDWVQLTTSNYVVPANTTKLRVYVQLDSNAVGTAWFDDPKVYKTPTVVQPDILYQNDFETSTTGWLGNFTVLDPSTSVSPTNSLKYTRASTSFSLFAGPDITTGFSIGQSYNASIMVKTALTGGSATEGARLVLVAYNSAGTFLAQTNMTATRATDWVQLITSNFIVPANTAKLRIYVQLDANAIGTAWFDDPKVYKTPPAGVQKYNFDAMPVNFSSPSPLSLGSEHVKDGSSALKWNAAAGAVLTANNLGISTAQTGSFSASNAQFYIYSPAVSNDTLVFRFYDNTGALKREGRMLLNYKGWRDYHRSYRYDYNYESELPAFTLAKMEIIYKPASPGASTTLYMDAFTMYGDSQTRIPGPHMKLDMIHFPKGDPTKMDFFEGVGATAYNCYNQVIPAAPSSSGQEQADAAVVKSKYPRPVYVPNAADVTAAKDYVTACNITRNPDGSITGKGLTTEIEDPNSLVTISTHVGNLARAAVRNNDADARAKLQLFVEYLLDQGLAEGGRNSIQSNNYTVCQNFPAGFLQSLSDYYGAGTVALAPEFRDEVIKMLKWSNEYNVIFHPGTPFLPVNTDMIHLKLPLWLELAGLDSNVDNRVRDLKAVSRYLSLFTNTTQGASDGLKPDGNGAHHDAAHMRYMYALGSWSERAYSLRNTSYKITQQAYTNMANTFKTLALQSSKGVVYPMSISGRLPEENFPITTGNFQHLIEIGGDLMGAAYEPNLAAFYNYIYQTNTYPVAAAEMDGYYHFNYANLGVRRKNNWMAMMKGLTDKLWGTEIYVSQNRYGRYQSYGAMEVLYNGDRTASGVPGYGGDGWDWNVTPGATTIHLPYSELQAKVDIATEYQKKSFAGALSLGQNGIFAMDFLEESANGTRYTPNNLKFHKSVFTFDNIFVCLGSGIGSTNNVSNTATNLFQGISTTDNPSIYVNSDAAVADATYSNVLSTATNSAWVVNGQTTGYYVPQGGGDITVARGSQTTPVYSTKTGSPTATANFSKAYISHGTSPNNAKYQFVMVPGTTPQDMAILNTKINNGEIYQVLSQTDDLHAVKYLPENLTSYAFFTAATDINIGKVKSISGEALLGVKEIDNTLEITLNNPNLKTIDDPVTNWRSTTYTVSLTLNGKWKAATNPNNVVVSADAETTTLTFSVIDGKSAYLKLVPDNEAPAVSITSPVADASFNAPATVSISANATDSDGTVSKVEFFQGETKLGEATAAPFNFDWTNVTAGTYSLTAKATDDKGAVTTSDAVSIVVNAMPTVSITSPLADASSNAPATIGITADAADVDGTITKVEFFQGEIKLGEATAAPFNFDWTNVMAGTYSLTAKATDNKDAVTISEIVTITVNALPTVAITSPVNNANYDALANITITANAADADGSVSKVEFFNGVTKLGEDATAPYSFNWNNVASGSYIITAKATDNDNAATTSETVNVNVVCPTVQLSIPDVYAMNPSIDDKNTIYLGYGPTSLTLNALAQDNQDFTYTWSTGATGSSTSVSQAGTYTVTASYAGGCQSTASIEIVVQDVRCGNNNDKVQICHNNNVICVAQSAVQTHLNHGDNLGSCSGTLKLASKEEVSTSPNFTVYPNPVQDNFNVSVSSNLNSNATIGIYNILGNKIREVRFIAVPQEVFAGDLPSGNYIVVVKNGFETFRSTIVKQ